MVKVLPVTQYLDVGSQSTANLGGDCPTQSTRDRNVGHLNKFALAQVCGAAVKLCHEAIAERCYLGSRHVFKIQDALNQSRRLDVALTTGRTKGINRRREALLLDAQQLE